MGIADEFSAISSGVIPEKSRFIMVPQSTAGVEFVGNLMRYAEVENDTTSPRLLRLGNCEFEFDAASVVYFGTAQMHIKTIQSALRDVFKDTTSSAFRFVLPSSALTQFESLVPIHAHDGQSKSQIGFETLLLNGGNSGGDIFPGDLNLKNNLSFGSYTVRHLSQTISERLRVLCEVFPDQVKGHLPSVNASIKSYRRLMDQKEVSAGKVLLIGCYPSSTDYIALSGGFSLKTISFETRADTDRIYFAHEVLRRLSDSEFKDCPVFVYGHSISPELMDFLENDFGKNISLLNPGPLVNLDQGRFEKGFPIQAFVPCLGASIE